MKQYLCELPKVIIMKKLLLILLFPISSLAQTPTANITPNINEPQFKTELEPQINVAKLEKREQNLPLSNLNKTPL